MKQIIIMSTIMLASITQLTAQSIQRNVIGSAGKVTSTGGITLRYTVGEAITTTAGNTSLKIKQGFQQGIMANTPLPLTGFNFFAQRINPSLVELQWKTMTEDHNKGFYIERKFEHETDFTALRFQPSLGLNGNSDYELNYSYQDENSYDGNSYYRIKQEDIDGRHSASLVRMVAGDVSKQLALQVWPIPAPGYFHLRVLGSNQTDIRILNLNGAVVKTLTLHNQMQQTIDDLKPGTYFISVVGDKTLVEKIVVQ